MASKIATATSPTMMLSKKPILGLIHTRTMETRKR
jgi:hypothetical protein